MSKEVGFRLVDNFCTEKLSDCLHSWAKDNWYTFSLPFKTTRDLVTTFTNLMKYIDIAFLTFRSDFVGWFLVRNLWVTDVHDVLQSSLIIVDKRYWLYQKFGEKILKVKKDGSFLLHPKVSVQPLICASIYPTYCNM